MNRIAGLTFTVGVWMLSLGPTGAARIASAQTPPFPCQEPSWKAFDPSMAAHPGVDGLAYDVLLWDPDGPGPISEKLVVYGSFGLAGSAVTNNIAAVDLATGEWSGFGVGTNKDVNGVTTHPTGDLIAVGYFKQAGMVTVNHIARWRRSQGQWEPMGTGLNNQYVAAVASLPNGDVLVGGGFTQAGGVPANHFARWDEAEGGWSAVGSGFLSNEPDFAVSAIKVNSANEVYIAGNFYEAGGIAANSIVRWDSVTNQWAPLGTGIVGSAYLLINDSNGDLIVGGSFDQAGGVSGPRVARWNGIEWSYIGEGIPGDWHTSLTGLTPLANGHLIAGGYITGPSWGLGSHFIKYWDGTLWTNYAPGLTLYNGSPNDSAVYSVNALPTGQLITTGYFTKAGGMAAEGIASWNLASGGWSSLAPGVLDAEVQALLPIENGDLIVAGGFKTVGAVAANRIARWNGSQWSAMGTGTDDWISTLASLPGGDVVAGGKFLVAGGVTANGIARWDGAAWSGLGSGMKHQFTSATVSTLLAKPGGELVAGGYFTSAGGALANHIAQWNGTAWSALGSGMAGSYFPVVRCLVRLDNGSIVAGGGFTAAGGTQTDNIALWNGANWSSLGAGMNAPVNALEVLQNGDVVAAGSFTASGGIVASKVARWDGTAWSSMNSGMAGGSQSYVNDLLRLENGDLIVGGTFTIGNPAMNYVARWNDSGWFSLGPGVTGYVSALAIESTGDLIAGGNLETAGGVVTPYLARFACPPPPPCQADCDVSGSLNIDDFICFQTLFALGDPAADCDASGSLNIDDFICFQTLFSLGC